MTRRGAGQGPLLARNTLLNLGGLGLPLVIAVFAIPPIVDGLGPQRFGILGLVWVALAYAALLDLGLGRATTRFAAVALEQGRPRELRAIVLLAAATQLVLGALVAFAALMLAGPAVERLLELPPTLEREVIRTFMVLAPVAPIITMTNSFRGLLEADQRFGWINAVRVPVSAANFLMPLLGVWLGWSLPWIVAGLLVARAYALCTFALLCVRRWPVLLERERLQAGRLRELLGFGGWVTVSALASALMVYLDRVAVAGMVSVEAAGYYTVPHEMVTRLGILPSSLVLTLFPAMAAAAGVAAAGGAAAGRRQQARLVTQPTRLLVVMILPALAALAILSRDLLTLWLDAGFAARAATPLRILALGMMVNALAYVAFAALHAANRPDLTARIHLAELPVHLLLLWVLVGRWGVVGAALAWAARAALDAALLFVALARIGVTGVGDWRSAGLTRPLLALGGFAGACALVTWLIDAPLGAVLATVALVPVWAAVVWLALLRPEERSALRGAVGLDRVAAAD